jgi:hypothetical protein
MATPPATPVAALVIPDDAWADHGEANTLWATVTVNGTLCHAIAIEVQMHLGMQEAVNAEMAYTLESYFQAAGADGPMETTQIGDREFLVFIEPFS